MRKTAKYTIWTGVSSIVAGFLYDTMFAGIPPQDAPEHLAIKYNQNQQIGSFMMTTGLIITAIGAVIWIALKLIPKN
jgi:vacuolar-type H+-ATPase subunit I/STV1